jgi:hypothetical protein
MAAQLLSPARPSASMRLASWIGFSTLWQGIARALRAAGPDSRSLPLHALMGDVHCVRGNDPRQRLRGG